MRSIYCRGGGLNRLHFTHELRPKPWLRDGGSSRTPCPEDISVAFWLCSLESTILAAPCQESAGAIFWQDIFRHLGSDSLSRGTRNNKARRPFCGRVSGLSLSPL